MFLEIIGHKKVTEFLPLPHADSAVVQNKVASICGHLVPTNSRAGRAGLPRHRSSRPTLPRPPAQDRTQDQQRPGDIMMEFSCLVMFYLAERVRFPT